MNPKMESELYIKYNMLECQALFAHGAGYSMVPVGSVSTTFGYGLGRRGTGERELQKC